jgi:hypothetical protein
MRWTLAMVLRPVTFVLAIVAAVLTGNRTDSFWYGLLAFFVASATGKALRALVRGRTRRALYRALWPAAAVGYAFLFAWLGLPAFAAVIVAAIAAGLTKNALGDFSGLRERRWLEPDAWGVPRMDDVIPGRWKEL